VVDPSGLAGSFVGQVGGANAATNVPASRSYDTAGRVTSTELASYGYDAAGRITSVTQKLYGPSDSNPANSGITLSSVTWTVGYDAAGRITSFNAPGSTATFSYDANGNRQGTVQSTANGTANGTATNGVIRSYTVGSNSNRLLDYSQITVGPSGSVTTSASYSYNANGDLVYDGKRYNYNAEGRMTSLTTGLMASSKTTRYAYNALGQRVFKTEPLLNGGTTTELASPTFVAALQAFYAQQWNPAITAEQAGWEYHYDEDGNLVGEYGTNGPDSVGTAKYMYLPTPNGPMPVMAFIGGRRYAVHTDHLNTPRRLTLPSGAASWQWKYSAFGDEQPTLALNANGDLVNDGKRYNYNAEGRMTSLTTGLMASSKTTRYAYNALGQRVFKTEPLLNGGTTTELASPTFVAALQAFYAQQWNPTITAEQAGWEYLYDEDGNLAAEYGTGGPDSAGSAKYMYLPTPNGPMPIVAFIDARRYAVHTHHLNTPRRLTLPSGAASWQWKYSAFGDEQPTQALNRFVNTSVNPNPGTTTTPAVTYNARYPGQYADKESGLNYNYFRTYNPETGRYTQADPIGLAGGWNRFGYVEGNPLSLIDPTGEFGIVGAGIGAGLELSIQMYKNYREGCDLLDINNYDWWDVAVSAAVGAVAPGAVGVGKTVWKSGNAAKTIASQLPRARTANRAAKLQRRLDDHTGAITEGVAEQASWQLYKLLGQQVNENGPRDCSCKR
jgi:RHS repeat-associated protein